MPSPMDEYPLHQVPLPIAQPASSDRNFYDRCYFNGHDRTGDTFLITGLGVYPNLGVIDAYATVLRGTTQHTVRMSSALGDDRMTQAVGPYRIEVVRPLEEIRVICDGDEHGVGFDLTWQGSFPTVQEPAHVLRRDGRIVLDACRFAQLGTWSGELRVAGETIAVDDDTWVGSRDRSWGIRPVGEAEPPGRGAAEPDPDWALWWTYVPLRFDDYALVLIMQEDADGHRSLNDAVRVWPASSGRPPESLGWPDVEITYKSGTRVPERASIRLAQRDGKPVHLEVESKGYVVLSAGPGYGGDPEWNHGQWMGRDWVQGVTHDLNDADVLARTPFGILDHVARADCDGQEGWGLFEHGAIGPHRPSGFNDFFAVAP